MILRAVNSVFEAVFKGKIHAVEAQITLHNYCNHRGMNPAVELPITMLMMTESGRARLASYENLIMKINWLIARVGAKEMDVDEAVGEFKGELNTWEEREFVRSERVCPLCNVTQKMY